MNIDKQFLDDLTAQAKASPRRRMNFDLRTQATEMPGQAGHDVWCDSSQRMLNAIEPGSVIPIHRHRRTSETVVVLRGRAVQHLYDVEGRLVGSVLLTPLVGCPVKPDVTEGDGLSRGIGIPAMNVEMGQWHRLESLESGTVILEMKDGAYEPIGKEDMIVL